ncbi:MAG TPA: PqqD family protein [Vicinamibacterales bacterium]|nr:PqqD family protein [Vicinamibacterales bacterium]
MEATAGRPVRVGEERFVTRSIAGETLLVPVSGRVADLEALYVLNEVGAFVWARLDGRHTVREIAAAVVEAYDVSLEQAERDVGELVAALESAGLVRRDGR